MCVCMSALELRKEEWAHTEISRARECDGFHISFNKETEVRQIIIG